MLDEPGLIQLSAVRLLDQIFQFICFLLQLLQQADTLKDLEDIDVCKYIINLYRDDDLSGDIIEGILILYNPAAVLKYF